MDVPPELAELKQWMLWRLEYGTKVPYQPSGYTARSNDPVTWHKFHDLDPTEYSGRAFVFSESDPYCGIDLDDCLTDGVWEPWAQEILNRFEGIAYAEISPGGTGVKLTTKAKKPASSRCTNQKGVECYDNKRFWTWTGNCLGEGFDSIGDGQAAVDWLIEKHLQAPERKTGERRLQPATGGSFALLARAESYVDNCDPGTKGNLRNKAFNIAGNLHAIVGELGERLSDTDVYSMLKRWNIRNSDQLRDGELQEAAVNARKNGTPPADKPPEMIVAQDDSDVDLSGILGEIEQERPDGVPFSPGDFPLDAIPDFGILGQVIDHNLKTAMFPQPELALAGALALMSVVTGRKVENEFSTRTNLYVLGLGESGSGKEHARKLNKSLLYAIGADAQIGPERIGSHAGLTTAVKDSLSVLFQIDEIGNLLATMKNPNKSPHLYNIGTVLMQMYSSADSIWIGDAYADAKKVPTVIQPHAVVYGTCTPDAFWNNLSADSIANGLLGRMVVFESPGRTKHRRAVKRELPDKLVEELRWWHDMRPGGIDKSNPIPMVATHEEDALLRYESHLKSICERQDNEPSDNAALWSRTGEKTAKLALIFACSRQPMSYDIRINLDDVNRAVKVSNWLTRRMLKQAYEYVSANYIEENKKRVLRIIGSVKSGIPMRELSRRTQWLRAKERTEIILELQDREDVVIEEVKTSGRNRTVVRRLRQ